MGKADMIFFRILKKTSFLAALTMACVFPAFAQQVSPVNTEVLILNPAANDDFLLPSYLESYPTPQPPQEIEAPTDVDILTAIFGPSPDIIEDMDEDDDTEADVLAQADNAPTPEKRVFYPKHNKDQAQAEPAEEEKPEHETPVLTPLPPLAEAPEPPIPPKKPKITKSAYVHRAVGKEVQNINSDFELPREMRILFYPNRVDLSAQNVMWIKAFAAHVMKDPRLILTIRISNQNWQLQKTRLTLLIQVALETGLSARQLKVYTSKRDVNSIVLGYAHNEDLTKIQPERDKAKPIKTKKTLSW